MCIRDSHDTHQEACPIKFGRASVLDIRFARRDCKARRCSLASTLPDNAENDDDDAADETCTDHGQRAVSRCGKLAGRLLGGDLRGRRVRLRRGLRLSLIHI